jgi:hypothetical protein
MRKALIVGIDGYEYVRELHGCVGDASAVASILERHGDGSANFGVRLLTDTGRGARVTRADLRAAVQELFHDDSFIALFYFAGHGHIEATGGYLVTSEVRSGDEGLSLDDVLTYANHSPAKNKVVVLDSCHSGVAGNLDAGAKVTTLSEGLTLLTAAATNQYAVEKNGEGVFTTLFVDALRGGAANLVGDITPGSVYAHIDQALGPWDQRPLFKTNVTNFVSLRRVEPPITPGDLRRITDLFPAPGVELPLNPSFEPERAPGAAGPIPSPDPVNTAKFAILQRYNRVNLVVPVGAPHMWHAAMGSKSCKLTVLGEHYRRLVAGGQI